jgi:hypothetical protein
MSCVSTMVLVTAALPLVRAWRANRRTSLLHAVGWGLGAWMAWLTAALVSCSALSLMRPAVQYLAVCLTGCAAVAVLGARRPGVGAWNFVVVGLLAVLLLPWFEGLEHLRDSPIRLFFVAATVGVGVLNYLPTRLGPAALLLGAACTLELVVLIWPESRLGTFERGRGLGGLLAGGSPWLALAALHRQRPSTNEFDRIWLGFRDRFGLVWGQRVREQFNRSAAHAGWPSQLNWQGHRAETPPGEDAILTLRALLKRFGPEEDPGRDH